MLKSSPKFTGWLIQADSLFRGRWAKISTEFLALRVGSTKLWDIFGDMNYLFSPTEDCYCSFWRWSKEFDILRVMGRLERMRLLLEGDVFELAFNCPDTLSTI